jgi:nucleotide-binding universal stress UspA family protein
MLGRILFPTDFSEHSRRALNCISQLPDVREIILLNVVCTSTGILDQVGLKSAKAELEAQARPLKEAGFNVEAIARPTLEGQGVADVIERVADEENISLIVISINTVRGGNLPEGTAHSLLCQDDTHLLMLPGEQLERDDEIVMGFCRHIFAKVLLPTDLSSPAKEAILFIARMKGIRNILLLHIISEDGSKDEAEVRIKKAANELKALTGELHGRSDLNLMPPLGVRLTDDALRCHICAEQINIACHVVIGNLNQEITKLAEKEKVSLIAMYSTEDGSGKGAECIISKVANSSSKPILVVRTCKLRRSR